MKLTINKLIANDMVNFALDLSSKGECEFTLKKYLNDFDEESQKIILDNIAIINKDVEYHDDVFNLSIINDGEDKKYTMIFNENLKEVNL